MKRSDRLLGVLLLLRSGRRVPAARIAERFEVSVRTIYRDVDTLSALGVPVYAERGRGGGFRLLEGYFLPAIAFTQDEAVSLLVSLTMLRSLRTRPFSAALDMAESKLLAAMPEHLTRVLGDMERVVGFESTPGDVFHPERMPVSPASEPPEDQENRVLDAFLQALFAGSLVAMRYHSPYRQPENVTLTPLGMFWDRDRWYLAGHVPDNGQPRLWRADRVTAARPVGREDSGPSGFDVRSMLGRQWLAGAMRSWQDDAPVQISLTASQAARLQEDWYYRHASYEPQPGGTVLMTVGEDNRDVVLELLRWLGPGAQIVQPREWRAVVRGELHQMLADHAEDKSV